MKKTNDSIKTLRLIQGQASAIASALERPGRDVEQGRHFLSGEIQALLNFGGKFRRKAFIDRRKERRKPYFFELCE